MNNPTNIQAVPQPKRIQRLLFTCVKFLLLVLLGFIALIAVLFFTDTVLLRIKILNDSMKPTLSVGQYVVINTLAVQMNGVQRGDIIMFHFPQNPKEDYVKRVIGTPGDSIVIRAKKVYVNNQEIVEPYIADASAYNGSWVVPEGNLFVLGDNRNLSSDSHSWGYVPINMVVGKALIIYWPLYQVKILE